MQLLEGGTVRELEAFTFEGAGEADLIVAVFLDQLGAVRLMRVGDILEEQHHQDVVLILGRIDRSAEGVAGLPGSRVDLVLGDFGGGFAHRFEKRY